MHAPLLTRPPNYWLSTSDFIEKYPSKWHKVFDKTPVYLPPPIYHGPQPVDFQSKLDAEYPETGVLELNNASLYGDAGWVISKEGFLLPDHSWYSQHPNEMGPVPAVLTPTRQLKGICLSLGSDFTRTNYGHFLLDCMSRIALFNKAGYRLSDVDHIFCPKPASSGAQQVLQQLGVPAGKCVWAQENTGRMLKTETLLVSSFPGARRNTPAWAVQFLKEKLSTRETCRQRRLFISRSGYKRNIVNARNVEAMMVKHGFEIYNPGEHYNSISDFAQSSVVAGAHGAALTDLVFCQPGTKVLELIPSDHVFPYYYTLSNAAGLDYSCLVGQSTRHRNKGAFGPSAYDFVIDEQELEAALKSILATSPIGSP